MVTLNYVRLIFSNLVGELPLLLVWLVGAAFAIAHWKQHRRVCQLALAGFLILILQIILHTGWLTFFTSQRFNPGPGYQFIFASDLAINLVFFALRLAGFVLIVLAVFQGRTGQKSIVQDKSEAVI